MSLDVFADCADLAEMEKWAPKVDGFTTNPSLARAAGVTDYMAFCREALTIADGKPISFEVVTRSDVEREARVLADLAPNVWVKVPWTEVGGWAEGLQINITGIFYFGQMLTVPLPSVVVLSVFAVRVADTGVDAVNVVRSFRHYQRDRLSVLWASAREVYNVEQAEQAGADIITLSPALLAKLDGFGRDLDDYSAETISQFYTDAEEAGLVIP